MSPTALLTPAYKLTFRQPGGGGVLGSLGGAASGSPLGSGGKVIYTTDEPQASTVVDLTTRLDMDVYADSFTLIMGQVGSFRPARDQQVDIELGFDDDAGVQPVMTGTLVAVEPNLVTRRLSGLSPAHLLLKTYVEIFYEEKFAGDIVKDLASRAGMQTADVENGIRFPAYVVDGRRSAFHHLRDLADLCGFDLYIDFEGKLVVKKFVGGRIVHVFDFAKHILELEVLQTQPRAATVEGWGESPGSGPTESWAWLTKDFSGSKGSAGSGDPKFLLERPALRTPTAARQAAEAAFTHFKRQAVRGKLLVTGSPQVRLGDAMRLQSVPEQSLNAAYQVRAVTHRLTKLGGFTTEIQFRSLE